MCDVCNVYVCILCVYICVCLQVVIPLYYAAVRYSSTHLLGSCAHYLCSHYGEVEDVNHEALLHLLDNTPPPAL